MAKPGFRKSDRMAFIMTEFSIAGFLLFRILDSMAEGSKRILVIAIAGNFLVMLLVALIHHLRRTVDESFFMPTMIYLMYVVSSLAMRSFLFFFPTCLGITCVGALYFNPRSLRNYIIVSNIVSITLMYFRLPMMHPTRHMLFTEMLMLWFINFFGSTFIYMLTTFASDKNTTANKAQDSFTALLSSTPNRIVLLDSLNCITYLSRSFLDFTNFKDPKMAIGRPVFDIFKNKDIKEMFYDILTRENLSETTSEITLNGKQHYFEILTGLLKHETHGRLVNIIDITPVMKAKFEAEAASESKSAFLATMSHEIRTPLNAIIGLSEIELQKKLPMETRQDLEKIHNSGANLLSIINDVLDISKIESGSFELVPSEYDVPSMINDTVQLNIVRIGSKPIVFKLQIDETIPIKLYGDELRVKQILNNLLSNAFKYTEEGSVNFRIGWRRRGGDASLVFVVQDTGRGMKKEDVPRIFSEYSQLDAKANRHIEGTGLGLSITRNLVSLMRGTITVDSKYGKGSTFTVRLPQRIVDQQPIGGQTARNLELFRFRENRKSHGVRLMRNYMPYGKVLVVDDVETNLDVARGLMLPYGLSIDFALSGKEAIEKICAAGEDNAPFRYDLVLMDHMMPGMDGMEAVRIIRSEIESEYAKNVPIIALTANALAGNEEMFLSNGFNAYISKPIDVMQLDVALNTWVRNKQSQDILSQAEMEKAQTDENTKNTPSVLDGLFLEGIDLVLGRERYNNENAYLDILRSYYLHTPALLEKMKRLSREEGGISLSEYAVVVHGLKGSSYGICANAVGRGAEELENAARNGDIGRVLADNAPFVEMVRLLLLDLEELLQKAEAGKKTKQKAAVPDPVMLSRLLDAASRYRASLMEEVLAGLELFEYESGGELISWLREQMDNLEYDAIRTRLDTPNPFENK